MHSEAFVVVESDPAGQGLHARSTDVEPSSDTNVPGAQSVHFSQASLLEPELNVPRAHASQVRPRRLLAAGGTTMVPLVQLFQFTHAVAGFLSAS